MSRALATIELKSLTKPKKLSNTAIIAELEGRLGSDNYHVQALLFRDVVLCKEKDKAFVTSLLNDLISEWIEYEGQFDEEYDFCRSF